MKTGEWGGRRRTPLDTLLPPHAHLIYVMVLLVAIDLISGTDDIWVHWVAGIWGAILGMHLIETLFFDGGLFGSGRHDRGSSQIEPNDNLRREHL